MTRPTVTTTTTTTAPVTAPPKPANPLIASPLFSASPLRAGPLSGGGGGPLTPVKPPVGRSPFRDPFRRPPQPSWRAGIKHRRTVIMPTLGSPSRNELRKRYRLEYSEICEVMEWEVGSVRLTPGMTEDFTELALYKAEQSQNWGDDSCCNWLAEGWCLNLDSEDDHQHPFGCDIMDADECPVQWSHEYEMRVEDAVDHKEVMQIWEEFSRVFIRAREALLANPAALLEQPGLGGTVAAKVLVTAGFEIPNGLHNGDKLVEILTSFLPHDRAVRMAFADLGVLIFGGTLGGDAGDAAEIFDEIYEKYDYCPMDPYELQFLTFPEDSFPVGGPRGRLQGLWICVDATYESFFDPLREGMREGYPFAIGWRELDMRRGE